MRNAPVVTLSRADRLALDRLVIPENANGKIALRAQIIRLAAEGNPNKQIAKFLGVTTKTVARWRQRFFVQGAEGIQKEKLKSGRPATISEDQRKQILAKRDQKRWTTRMVARVTGVSAATVRRIWKLPIVTTSPRSP